MVVEGPVLCAGSVLEFKLKFDVLIFEVSLISTLCVSVTATNS